MTFTRLSFAARDPGRSGGTCGHRDYTRINTESGRRLARRYFDLESAGDA